MPSAMDTFRALAPPEGLRFTPLFNEPAEGADARLVRLENAVQQVRNDLDTVVPTLVRMVAIEKDIKGLVAQLQTLTDGGPSQPVPEVTPEELPPEITGGLPIPGEDVAKGTEPAGAPIATAGPDTTSSLVTPEAAPKGELPPEGAASPISNAPLDIKPPAAPIVAAPAPEIKAEAAAPPSGPVIGDVGAIRIADHADKTRVVLDMTAKTSGAARLENNGRTLVIPLTDMNWLGKQSWLADSGKLISEYRMEEGNLHVELMYASQIKSLEFLSPGDDNPNYRLMIDLFSPEVHQ